MKRRDSQRSKLYRAESSIPHKLQAEHLPEVKDIERFVAHVLASRWLCKRYPPLANATIEVRNGQGCRYAYGGYWQITMPRWSRYKLIVLHELAHSFMKRLGSLYPDAAAHGWEYANLYLELVRHFLGKERATQLKAAFKKFRVRFRPRRTVTRRTISPKALEALARYRAQRQTRKDHIHAHLER